MATKYAHTTFLATQTGPLIPGSDEWARTVSASKVPAILGISKWDSAYSLWARATGRLESEAGNKATERGTYLEPAIRQWLADQLPGNRVTEGATFVHPDCPTHIATPDALIYEGRRRTPWALGEVKTAYNGDEWGKAGTADVPADYMAQVAWQMWITGARTVYVAALVNMEFRLYVIRWEDVAGDMEDILAMVAVWEHHVAEDIAPDWDGSDATLAAVRRMHPDIDPEAEAVIPEWWALELWSAIDAEKAAVAETKRCKSRILGAAGSARSIVTEDGRKAGTRSAKNGGTPYLTPAKYTPATLAA
ncbi:lambda-exonuclease family protein [Citricoccus nitrophenolicus]|uniref:Lambda-exonuclease family protein n=1 Tax=Citricoccus nitrophenolicus TaxID=863575 RepID=A0ABV0IFG7_9MICC